jgi:hypothetical protein
MRTGTSLADFSAAKISPPATSSGSNAIIQKEVRLNAVMVTSLRLNPKPETRNLECF